MDMRSPQRTLSGAGLGDAAAVAGAVALVGASYGAIAQAAGFPLWQVAALAAAVLAGSAELVLVGLLAAGAAPLLAAGAALLVNTRNFAYGMAVAPFLRRGPSRALAAHFVNDETVALSLARPDGAGRRAAFWAGGLAIAAAWPGGALAGYALGSLTGDPAALGLDAVFPTILLAMVVPALRDRRTAAAVIAGALIAAACTPLLPAGAAPPAALLGLAAIPLLRPLERRFRR